jgi:hypothetical protein
MWSVRTIIMSMIVAFSVSVISQHVLAESNIQKVKTGLPGKRATIDIVTVPPAKDLAFRKCTVINKTFKTIRCVIENIGSEEIDWYQVTAFEEDDIETSQSDNVFNLKPGAKKQVTIIMGDDKVSLKVFKH